MENDSSIALNFVDRNQLSTRPIVGIERNEPIEINRKIEGGEVQKLFSISFEKTVEEESISYSCVNYPTKIFKSLKDCDDQFLKKSFKKYGLNPVWIRNESEEVTVLKRLNISNINSILSNFQSGVTPSTCKLPCKSTSVKTR